MNSSSKILSDTSLSAWLRANTNRKIVLTNGCFDLLHYGHVAYLEEARGLGDVLIVGVNSDVSVRGLKGPTRPINTEQHRAGVVAGLASVDAVYIFTSHSALYLIGLVQPDVYVKGGDYTIDTINQMERVLVEANGGEVKILKYIAGLSTTAILKQAL